MPSGSITEHVKMFLSSGAVNGAGGTAVPIRPGGRLVGNDRLLVLNSIFLSNSAGTLTIYFGDDEGEAATADNTIFTMSTGTLLLGFHETPVVGPKGKGLRVISSVASSVGVLALGRAKSA